MHKIFVLSHSVLFLILVFGYQNCGEGFKAISSGSFGSIGGDVVHGDVSRSDLEPNLVTNCLGDPNYNACIFWKNPVAQNGAPLPRLVQEGSDLSPWQLHAINFSGFDNSGRLRNSFIHVSAIDEFGNSISLSTNRQEFKFYYNDSERRLSQVMAFHWLNLQSQYMLQETGAFYALGKNIDVVAYDPSVVSNAYWSPSTEQVVLGVTPEGNEFSLSAEVYAHEMGHANLTYASDFKIHEVLGIDKNRTCDTGIGVCCRTVEGCSWAINEGQADYHSAILFPERTAFLETYTNTLTGISECGVSRAMDAIADLTASQAYGACFGSEGEVHLTGRIYSSVWWEVRQEAESLYPRSGADEIDELFTEHLPALNGDDDFLTAIDKIEATDRALFSGRYSQLFINEFARRGIVR